MGEKATYIQGACRFCGQTLTVEPCKTQDEADELATKRCKCEDGQQLGKRDKTLRDAKADIKDLFGEAAEARGELSLPENERALLYDAATLVLDQCWRRVTVNVTQGLKAKISVTDRGKLTIQRDDSSTRKREHK